MYPAPCKGKSFKRIPFYEEFMGNETVTNCNALKMHTADANRRVVALLRPAGFAIRSNQDCC